MGSDTKPPVSVPPDTGEIDTDWGGEGPPTIEVRHIGLEGDTRATAIPPKEYEGLARTISAGLMPESEARRALSPPSVPAPSPDDEEPATAATVPPDTEPATLEPSHDSIDRLEAAIPRLASVEPRSGPHAIPLDLPEGVVDVGPETLKVSSPRAERPTPVQGYDLAELAAQRPTWVDPIEAFGGDEPPTEPTAVPFPAEPATDETPLAMPDGGGALDMVDARATPLIPEPSNPPVEMRDRYAVGDFSGALDSAEAILKDEPANADALRYAESCRDILTQMYAARLGARDQVPRVIMKEEDIRWLTLDHRSGFLLSCIDGRSTIDEILDVSGMAPLETLRILSGLLQKQVIEIRPKP